MIILSPISHFSSVAENSGHLSSDLDEETIILDVRSGQYYGLDGPMELEWSFIHQAATIGADCDRFHAECSGSDNELRLDGVIMIVQALFDEGLVTFTTEGFR